MNDLIPLPPVGADAYGLSAQEAVDRLTAVLKGNDMADLIPNILVTEPVEPAEDKKLYWRATARRDAKAVDSDAVPQ